MAPLHLFMIDIQRIKVVSSANADALLPFNTTSHIDTQSIGTVDPSVTSLDTKSGQNSDFESLLIVVETTPQHILHSVSLTNYYPKKYLRRSINKLHYSDNSLLNNDIDKGEIITNNIIAEDGNNDFLLSKLYQHYEFVPILIRLPDTLYQIIWLFLQVGTMYKSYCCTVMQPEKFMCLYTCIVVKHVSCSI